MFALGEEISDIYNQDSFLYSYGGEVGYYDRNGELSFSPGNDITINDLTREYFTKISKNYNKSNKHKGYDKSDKILTIYDKNNSMKIYHSQEIFM